MEIALDGAGLELTHHTFIRLFGLGASKGCGECDPSSDSVIRQLLELILMLGRVYHNGLGAIGS